MRTSPFVAGRPCMLLCCVCLSPGEGTRTFAWLPGASQDLGAASLSDLTLHTLPPRSLFPVLMPSFLTLGPLLPQEWSPGHSSAVLTARILLVLWLRGSLLSVSPIVAPKSPPLPEACCTCSILSITWCFSASK